MTKALRPNMAIEDRGVTLSWRKNEKDSVLTIDDNGLSMEFNVNKHKLGNINKFLEKYGVVLVDCVEDKVSDGFEEAIKAEVKKRLNAIIEGEGMSVETEAEKNMLNIILDGSLRNVDEYIDIMLADLTMPVIASMKLHSILKEVEENGQRG